MKETEIYYRVVTGDTMQKIAKQFDTTVERLIYDNIVAYPTIAKDFVCVGWVLKV